MNARTTVGLVGLALAMAACGGSEDETASNVVGSGGGAASGGNSASGGSGGSAASGGGLSLDGGGGSSSGGSDGDAGPGCASQVEQAELDPAYLFFLLDHSGSMGDGVHGTASQKWDPASAALKAFFSSPTSGISASMTLFPPDLNQTTQPADSSFGTGAECLKATYTSPDVAMTPLPSGAFGTLIDSVTPPNEWGTPTEPALGGIVVQAEALLSNDPAAAVAIVIVTDGEPAQCSTANTIQRTADVAAATAVPTYVIGVGSNLTNLNQIAQAGGTGQAFLVAVNDPQQTQQDLLDAINSIRGSVLSCVIDIPEPPPGETLDPEAVNVDFVSGGTTTELGYNETCQGGTGWRYDDPAQPTTIELCPTTCDTAKQAVDGKLSVVFGCERRVAIPK